MSQALSPARASLALLRGSYPNATITAETVAAYEAALADLDGQDVLDAVTALVKESKFMPTIAEIRTVVAEQKLALPSPTEAWGEAQARAFGTWKGPRHPLVHQAILIMGGAYSIKTSEKPSITQTYFIQHYTELRGDLIRQFVRTGVMPELPELPTPMRLVELPSGEFEQIMRADGEDWDARLLTDGELLDDGDFDGIRKSA